MRKFRKPFYGLLFILTLFILFKIKFLSLPYFWMESLTDPSCGSLNQNKKFDRVYDGYPKELEVFIESHMAGDTLFEKIKNTRKLSLVKRFQINNAWSEIYEISDRVEPN